MIILMTLSISASYLMPRPSIVPQVWFYNAKAECIGEHTLRIPRDATFGAALTELKRILGPAYAEKKIRSVSM
jgi:hypothetical protein